MTGLCAVSTAAGARSTMVAGLAAPAIAGPDLDQVIEVCLHCFPGDGEAIHRIAIEPEAGSLDVSGGTSALGEARATGQGLEVDYARAPLGGEAVDTVQVRVRAQRLGPTGLGIALYSSASAGVAHRVRLGLAVEAVLAASVSVEPERLFRGQGAELRITVRNLDGAGRPLEAVEWQWPPGLQARGAAGLDRPLAAGQAAEIVVPVRVDVDVAPGPLALRGVAAGSGMAASPLPEVTVEVAPGLRAELVASSEPALVGAETAFAYVVRNAGSTALDVDTVYVEVPFGVAQVQVADPGADPAGAGDRAVLATGVRLGPGEEMRTPVRAVLRRAGPVAWQGWYRLAGGEEMLPIAGRPVLAASLPPVETAHGDGGEGRLHTDVGAVTEALEASLRTALAGLPWPPGEPLYLQADDGSQKKNWVLEDALAGVLLEGGHRVGLGPDRGDQAPAAAVLRYRLLSSKAVYTPDRGGWNPFATGQQRRAVAGALLRLAEPGGEVTWARQVRTDRVDRVPGGAADWLGGGGEGVDRVEVPANFRPLELSLSGLIVGGLAFVFLVP